MRISAPLAFTVPADTPNRPLNVLYLGPVSAAIVGGGGSRTNYVYLPGQTVAPEAIYFDHREDVTQLTDAYLKHFDPASTEKPL